MSRKTKRPKNYGRSGKYYVKIRGKIQGPYSKKDDAEFVAWAHGGSVIQG